MAVITLNDYKAYAQINSPNQDAKLTPMVAMVNSFIENYIGYSVGSEKSLQQTVTPQGNEIYLNTFPVASVSKIVIKRFGQADQEIAAEKYYVDRINGIIEILDPSLKLPTNPRSIEVQYRAGSSSVASDLKLAALELVMYYDKREFKNSVSSGDGQSVGFQSIKTIPPQVKAILDLHRII